jgi:hypothetical protein
MAYTIKLRGKTHSVETLEAASALFESKQDRLGKIIRSADIFENGVKVARVSQNGNVWPVEPWFPGQAPLVRVSGLFA